MALINIVYDLHSDWILPRLAKHLVETIPGAEACSYKDFETLNNPSTLINYYINDDYFLRKTDNFDIVFFDHPKESSDNVLKADHVIAMAPQYQRLIKSKGKSCDLVIQPTDTSFFSPKLVLGFVGRFCGRTDYSDRKGKDLFDKVKALPFIEIKATLGELPQEQLPEFYRSVDYIFVPSKMEGGPMCLTEALACGKKVIMPLSIGAGELFQDGVIDYQVNDFKSLYGVISALYEEKKKLSSLVGKYTWENWTAQHEGIFSRVIQENNLTLNGRELERAIVVVATPEIDELFQYTQHALESYAKNCNASLIIFRDCPPEYQHPKYLIFKLAELKAKRILHIDADCYPLPDAPDIFNEHPPGHIYCWNEKEIRPPGDIPRFQKIINEHTGEEVNFTGDWWNPGVMLLDKEHLGLFKMPPWDVTAPEYLWYGSTVKNQPYINWLFAKNHAPVKSLNRKWNMITSLSDSDPDNAYILHFGCEKVPDAFQRKLNMAKTFSVAKTLNRKRFLMATVIHGDHWEELYKLVKPYHEAYAKRHGFDYTVIRSPRKKNFYPSPSWWKLELKDVLDEGGYDAVFFCDGDAIPWENAPNIINEVPEGKFGAFNSFTLGYMKAPESDAVRSYKEWAERSGNTNIEITDQSFYPNCGVWVCWKDAREILSCDNPVESKYYTEQHTVSHNLYKRPELFHPLDRKWNYGHLGSERNLINAVRYAYIAHLNGVAQGRRIPVLKDMIHRRSGGSTTMVSLFTKRLPKK